jgi:hypothetical protein
MNKTRGLELGAKTTAHTRPAARSEGPEAAILAAVRPLGPVRSWVGLGVVRGVQLGPWAAGFDGRYRHRGWLLCPSSVPAAGGGACLASGLYGGFQGNGTLSCPPPPPPQGAMLAHPGLGLKFCRSGLLELAASPSIGNGASPLFDGRPPLICGGARGEAKGLTPAKRKIEKIE